MFKIGMFLFTPSFFDKSRSSISGNEKFIDDNRKLFTKLLIFSPKTLETLSLFFKKVKT